LTLLVTLMVLKPKLTLKASVTVHSSSMWPVVVFVSNAYSHWVKNGFSWKFSESRDGAAAVSA